jgi:hypothetical protein
MPLDALRFSFLCVTSCSFASIRGREVRAGRGHIVSSISYRSLRAEDVDAVFDAAREAWQFTYTTILDAVFIEQFVRTNYAPNRLSAPVPLIAAQGSGTLKRVLAPAWPRDTNPVQSVSAGRRGEG